MLGTDEDDDEYKKKNTKQHNTDYEFILDIVYVYMTGRRKKNKTKKEKKNN